jgi:hypothetical protein
MNLPGMGFPGISHETAIFELGHLIGNPTKSRLENPISGNPEIQDPRPKTRDTGL